MPMMSCDIHTHAHAQDTLYNNLYSQIEKLEVCRTFSGRGMGMNVAAQMMLAARCHRDAAVLVVRDSRSYAS